MSHNKQNLTLTQDQSINDSIDNSLVPDSDLSMSDDDWVLSLIASLPKRANPDANSPKSQNEMRKHAKSPPPPILKLDDDEIVIPAVFTTQGAKNSRLLRQSEEINRQMTSEEAKMKAQTEALTRLRANILDELNDNGAQFRYSMKNDAELVERYVLKVYAKDHTLETHRHFFYFDDVGEVGDSPGNEMIDMLLTDMASQWEVSNHGNLLLILVANDISMGDIANHVCRKVYDEHLLELVDSFVVYVSKQLPLQTKSINISETHSIDSYLSLLGARTKSRHLLRLVHYNNNVRVLILKLCIAFHVSFMATNASDDLAVFIRHYLLSMSDFIINKREKILLLEKFVRPVFQHIISVCNDVGKVTELVKDLLRNLPTHFYGEEKTSSLKNHEMHYNIINNLWMVFCQESGHCREVTEVLMLDFLQFENSPASFSVVDLAHIISMIGRTKVSQVKSSIIYKNIYRAYITTALLTNLVYGQKEKNKHDYFSLRQCLLDCKDHIQESIARLLYMSMDDVPDKVLLSMAVGETYHVIDQFTSVLDKNIVFLKRDFFYS